MAINKLMTRIFKGQSSDSQQESSVEPPLARDKAHRRFHATLPFTLLALSTALGMVGLGFWQLDRARQKQAVQTAYLERQRLPALVTEVAPRELLPGRRLELHGAWRAAPQLLLDNQVRGGRPGYSLYSAFQLKAGWLMVNRGWVAAAPRREQAPQITAPPAGAAVLRGALARPPATGLRLGGALHVEKLGPTLYRVQHLDTALLAQIFGSSPLPLELRMDPDQQAGYLRDWQVPASGHERNLGYAFQWFCMATLVLVLYLVLGRRAARASKTR